MMIDAVIKLRTREKVGPSARYRASRRRAAIARYHIFDTSPETDFDDVARLAASIFRTPFAAISFIDDDRQWFKAAHGLGVSETPIQQSFCAFAIRSDNLFLVKDANRDTRFATNPLVTGPPHIRFLRGHENSGK